MGTIIDGVFHPDKQPEVKQRSATLSNINEANHWEREHERHAHNLIQPHNPDGTPNQDFIDYFP